MTDLALVERITRSLAFMLRHQPEAFDLEVDAFGWADLDEVVRALNERLGEPVDRDDVFDAVEAGDRVRYEIRAQRVRALYGHSIPVEPGEPSKPEEILYVAIPSRDVERAMRFGLRGGRRRFLHLALTKDDARESGRRAAREYTVLSIEAIEAWEEGINFYDRAALWLAEEVPTQFLEVEGEYEDGTDPRPRRGRGRPNDRERGGRGGARRGRGRGRGRDDDRERGDERRSERGDRGGRRDREEREARPERSERSERNERSERSERSERPERPERPERSERPERGERREREERSDRGRGRGRGRGRDRDDRGRDRGDRERPRRDREESRTISPAPRQEPKKKAEPARSSAARTEDFADFGAGLEPESPRQQSTPRPAPTPPPAREEPKPSKPAPKPADDEFGGFGAGL